MKSNTIFPLKNQVVLHIKVPLFISQIQNHTWV